MIGKRLVALREDADLQQKELADILNVSQTSISAYERDANEPPDEIKIKIAQYFNVSLDYLIGATELNIPLTRDDIIELPKNFPKDLLPKVIDYINVLYENHSMKQK